MNLPSLYEDKFKKKVIPKVDYEYQAIGLELSPIYGKKVWTLFYKFPLKKIEEAHRICEKKKKGNYGYFYGILRKL